jgi:uncharacterized protein (TIGR00730 family)
MSAPGPLAGRTVAVFGSSTLRPEDLGWALAEELGQRLAAAGAQVVNGGYGGAMEAVSRGARAAGGRVVGVTVTLFPQRAPNPYLSEERRTRTLMERLHHLMRADAFVALDGGLGTVTEFFLVWNHIFLDRSHGPLICLGESWRERLQTLGGNGFGIESEVRALVRVATDPVEAVRMLAAALEGSAKAEGVGG